MTSFEREIWEFMERNMNRNPRYAAFKLDVESYLNERYGVQIDYETFRRARDRFCNARNINPGFITIRSPYLDAIVQDFVARDAQSVEGVVVAI